MFWSDRTKYGELWPVLVRILECRKMQKRKTSNSGLVNAGVKLKVVILRNTWFTETNINSFLCVSSQGNCKQSVNNLSRIITGFMLMFVIILQININPCLNALVQGVQWKRQNHVCNLFQVSNKDTRTTSTTSFWCLYY